VMWDTFRPLNLSTAWRAIDNPRYAYSWNEDKWEGGSSSGNGAVPSESVVTGPSA
jgi:hypothetical protein